MTVFSPNHQEPDLRREVDGVTVGGHRVTAIVPVDLLCKVANYGAIPEVAPAYALLVRADAAEGRTRYPTSASGRFLEKVDR